MDVAQGLASDARGHAYVLVGGPDGTDSAYAAIVDLGRGAVVRTLPLSGANEAVLALVAEPAGRQLYAAVWRWDEYGYYAGQGRILTIDSATGALLGQYILPNNTAATDLALAPAPGVTGAAAGVATAVYAAIATPGPSRSDDENWWAPATRFALAAFDSGQLAPLATWPLDQAPNALALTADGRRAYMLAGPSFGAPWSRRLVSLDLLGGGVVHRWPLPEGCLALAASHIGKLYVADLVGDRLWRVDTLTDTFLGSIPMPGGPLAITARRS
jgi:hypothetical protein